LSDSFGDVIKAHEGTAQRLALLIPVLFKQVLDNNGFL